MTTISHVAQAKTTKATKQNTAAQIMNKNADGNTIYFPKTAQNQNAPTEFDVPLHRLATFEKMQRSNWLSILLKSMVKQPVAPQYADYLRMRKALVSGDQLMDPVIEWVMQDPKTRRKQFETALFQGLAAVPEPSDILTAFFAQIEQRPNWVDDAKLQRAVQFTHRLGINNGLVLRDLSLMAGYLYPGFNQPLLLTGALKKQAGTRLAETSKWWVDITEPDALQRFNSGFTSTTYVRFIHALVRHQLKKSSRWDSATWGWPINQYDLAMTNLAFSSVVLLGVRALGVFPSKAEVADYLHFWRYIGWLMGVDEEWLIEQESDGWRLLYWMQFAHPESDQSSQELGASLSKEPFERQYAVLKPLQQKLAYKQHLQITQFFIGRKRMNKLGLPTSNAAWFAYFMLARNLVLHTAAKHSESVDEFLIKRGRLHQRMGLALYANQAKQLASMHQS